MTTRVALSRMISLNNDWTISSMDKPGARLSTNLGLVLDSTAELKTILVDEAIDELRRGNVERHNALVAARARELSDCDVVMLAHFSTSRAAAKVREKISVPVLTAPHAAVERMRNLVEAGR